MARDTKILFWCAVAAVLFCGVAIYHHAWQKHHTEHAEIVQSVQRDTHGMVRVTGFARRHGVSIVRLSTPRGPEIGYLIRDRYLALGPLMDLKTGINVTPTWEKDHAK
jgi:hypothetical protein